MRTLVLLLIPVLTACGTAADTHRCEIAVTGDTTATIKAESQRLRVKQPLAQGIPRELDVRAVVAAAHSRSRSPAPA